MDPWNSKNWHLKIQDQASILKHKTNLAVNTLTIPYGQWWGRVKWLMGYWQVKLYQSQVNLLEKICFDFEPNPVRVDKSGLHLKKSTFRLFSLAAYDSPLKKTPKKSKNARGYMSKKRTRMKPLSHFILWISNFVDKPDLWLIIYGSSPLFDTILVEYSASYPMLDLGCHFVWYRQQ